MEPGPYHPLFYWPHVAFGISTALVVLVPIFSRKGSTLHRQSGRLFAIAMAIAAVSALYFSSIVFAPPAILSAITAIYAIGAAILTLRARRGWRKHLERALLLVPLLLFLFTLASLAMAIGAPERPPIAVIVVFAGVMLGLYGWLTWGDFSYLRASDVTKLRRYRRHAVRMAIVATEVVRAPLMSFGPPIFGELTGSFYMFAPYVLVPLIYYGAMPAWVKVGDEAYAAKLSTAIA